MGKRKDTGGGPERRDPGVLRFPTDYVPPPEEAAPAATPASLDEWAEGRLDLNQHLIKRPHSTFYVRVSGDGMAPTLQPGDLLVVDASLAEGCASGDVVV